MYWTKLVRGQGATHIMADEVETLAEAVAWCRGAVHAMAAMDENKERAAYRVTIFDADRDRLIVNEWVQSKDGRKWNPRTQEVS